MFTIITWNIQSTRAGTPDQIIEAVHSMGRFDVLCLQEVGGAAENQFEQLAARLPAYTAISAFALDTAGEDGQRYRMGSMIFTRQPVLQVFRHSLPWPADAAVMSMPRIALEATLDTPLGLIGVTCAHLEYFSLRQRMAQVEQLRTLRAEAQAHAMCARPGDASAGPFQAVPRAPAAILAGDFNFLPDSPEHLRLLAQPEAGMPPLCDAWQLAFPGRLHGPTVGLHDDAPGAGAPFTFDYVFISDDLSGWVQSVQVGQGRHGSAHQPMRMTLA